MGEFATFEDLAKEIRRIVSVADDRQIPLRILDGATIRMRRRHGYTDTCSLVIDDYRHGTHRDAVNVGLAAILVPISITLAAWLNDKNAGARDRVLCSFRRLGVVLAATEERQD